MNCKQGAVQLIDQIISTMHLITEDQYVTPLDIFNGSTLGKHFRHIHDFFTCLLEQCNNRKLDYAVRKRDRNIEENKSYAIDQFSNIKETLSGLQENQTLKVYADFTLKDGSRPLVNTSLGRELMYAYDHAVHHLAIVKIGLKSIDPSIPLNEEMGIAASTINHQYAITHGH